jgi:hypothetical protein
MDHCTYAYESIPWINPTLIHPCNHMSLCHYACVHMPPMLTCLATICTYVHTHAHKGPRDSLALSLAHHFQARVSPTILIFCTCNLPPFPPPPSFLGHIVVLTRGYFIWNFKRFLGQEWRGTMGWWPLPLPTRVPSYIDEGYLTVVWRPITLQWQRYALWLM